MKELYFEWAVDYCNQDYQSLEESPAGFKLAVENLADIDPFQFNVASQSLHDMSTTFKESDEGIPKHILKWLQPYRRLKSL